jgi:hypothetical protein
LRPQQSGADDILRILTRDGALLAECGPGPLLPEHGLHGGAGKRLLRYYISNADRRVVLEDGRGSSWLARITGTRWRGNQRVWSFRGQRNGKARTARAG